MQNEMENQDAFRWSYKNRFGSMEQMYWCCSRIGIWNSSEGILVDTFWSTNSGKCFGIESCEEELELEYLGNLLDFEPASESDQAMYNDEDFLNLNHSNSSRGNCYLRKGAVKSKEKMIKVIKRNATKLKEDYEYAKRAYHWELDKLENIESVQYVSANQGVSVADYSYEDDMINQGE